MSADSPLPEPRGAIKICSACGAMIARKDCHHNRYGEYICHDCQAHGVRFTWNRRLHVRWREFRKARGQQVTWALIVCGAATGGLLWLFRLLD